MDCLYVCQFSNGHIKVGRSINPEARIASHVDRVACMGVDLVAHHIVECVDRADQREGQLISCCSSAGGARRFKSEWFDGLEFDTVCAWADHFAKKPMDDTRRETRWTKLIDELLKSGWTKTRLAQECNCGATTISRLALGQQEEPMYSVGERLLQLKSATA
jgi:hypothetical protein